MNKIIKLENFKRERAASKDRDKLRRIQGGYAWADLALKIMLEEMAKRNDIDYDAVWYSFIRFSTKMLKQNGWTDLDIKKTFADVFKDQE